MGNSSLTASIQILDDDSLLNVFHLYRPFLFGEDEDNDSDSRHIGGLRGWDRGRWWHKLSNVCQRWRRIILGSASYLGISLVCTIGTPVADVLVHSPLLPLTIDYSLDHDITAEDEGGVILALKQHNRVRHVRLRMPSTSLQKFVLAMDNEYPILEYLIIGHPDEDSRTVLKFPETLRAPRARHLTLGGLALPVGSRLLTTAVGVVTLYLFMSNPSTHFHPNTLLRWLSFMPQLEILLVGFVFAVPNRDIESQLMRMPVTPVTLPNLRVFRFQGVRTYLEALVHQITAPRLKKLGIRLFDELTFSVPRLLQFLNTIENLRFKRAKFKFFDEEVDVEVYPHEGAKTHTLAIAVDCCHLDRQILSTAQIFNSLSPMFSAVEHLTFEHQVHNQLPEEHNVADRTQWRKLLNSFKNLKTLRIDNGLVKELSRCLQLDDGELLSEVLPELQEITYSGSGNTGDALTSFIDARQNAGHSVTLIRS